MHKVLLVQFRLNEVSALREQSVIRQRIGLPIRVDSISALDKNIDWENTKNILNGYSGVILGGSGELDFDGGRAEDDEFRNMSYEVLDRLRPLYRYLFSHDIPTLGICYGHQMLGAFAGAQVHSDPRQRKTRSHKVTVVPEASNHALFSGLPTEFVAHYGHKDVLDRVPDNAVLLVSGGEACQVSALRYQTNIFSVQFHPELTAAEMVDRIKNSPAYMPNDGKLEDVFVDDPSSNRLLHNFGRYICTVAN